VLNSYEKSCNKKVIASAIGRGKIEVAQHGYNHSLYRVTYNRINSEFVSRPYSEQFSLIKAGRHALEKAFGVPVTSFIPPWNSYDKATIKCLNKLGFTVLSADARVGPGWPNGALKSVPVTCELTELRQAIDEARDHAHRTRCDVFIVCLFHPYDFLEFDRDRGWLTVDTFEKLWTLKQQIGIFILTDSTKIA